MNYKPTEIELISYLYGELSGEEKIRVEHYLQSDVEAMKKYLEMVELRKILNHVEDKEIIAPPILAERTNNVVFWRSTSFRTVLSVAASFFLLVLFAKMLDLRIHTSGNEVRIAFGPVENEVTPQPSVTSSQVQQMIEASLSKNNDHLENQWTDNQDELNHSIQQNLDLNSKKIDGLLQTTSLASQAQIQQFVSGLQDQNLKLVKDYFQLSTNDQKTYLEGLLIDFSKYLKEQRNQDLLYLQTRMNSIENNTDLFKQETEQILSGIITNVNSTQRSN